jgi:hypothetical protein
MMKKHWPKVFSVGSPAIYRIIVFGHADADLSDELGGMQMTPARSDDGSETMTLVGRVADQGALIGVLNALYSMRMPVLSVECLEVDEG